MDRVAETFRWGTRIPSKTNYRVTARELVEVKKLDPGILASPAPWAKVTVVVQRFRNHVDTFSDGMRRTTEYSRPTRPGLRGVEDP